MGPGCVPSKGSSFGILAAMSARTRSDDQGAKADDCPSKSARVVDESVVLRWLKKKKKKKLGREVGLQGALQVVTMGVEGAIDDHMSKFGMEIMRKERQMNSHYDAMTTRRKMDTCLEGVFEDTIECCR